MIQHIVKEILDEREKKIFICHNINKEILKDALNCTLVPTSLIKGKAQCNKFTDGMIKADYLIIDEVLDIETINKLNGGKMKELVHGDFSNNKGELLSAKKLIIICNSNSLELIFPQENALIRRTKFIL